MRKPLVAILIFVVQFGVAQLMIKPIIKPEKDIKGRLTRATTVNPAALPFWDDFSVTTDSPDSIRVWGSDTTSQWNYSLSKNVYVNATLAVNPPTYNVATFDGLDANGAYHAGSDIGLADELVSDTIDLQGRANVVLSFYWQAGGNVEIPDEGDSLILQFYKPSLDSEDPWEIVWSMDGGDLESDQDSVFTQEAIPIPLQFLTQKFLFRFQSYGDKDGPFDAWHVDWIYLNENRSVQQADLGYEDGAFTSNLSSPITPFSSIPIKQFTPDNRYIQNQNVSVSYLNGIAGSIYTIDLTYLIEIKNNSQLLVNDRRGSAPLLTETDTTLLIGFTEEIRARDPLILAEQDFSSLTFSDSVVLESTIYFLDDTPVFLDGTDIDLRVNDTIRSQCLLHNFYAFDDGSAEYAAGTNINGAQIAVKFWLEQPDTLTHIDIYFPNIDPISGGSPIELRVFKNLTDEPIKTQDVLVINGAGINKFTRYELSRPLLIADTFYVGYQQSKNEYIGIGFDKSNPQASQYIYENKAGEWEQNVRLSGALMIRPVFATVGSIVLGTDEKELSYKAYPNPTTGLIQIEGDYHFISVIDFSGRSWIQEKSQKVHDFTNLKAGLYLLTIHRKEGDQTLKIIKE